MMKNKELNLESLNGNEIIDFLNKESRINDYLCDISISKGSFVFENQEIQEDKYMAEGVTQSYVLHFTASFNNWGTEQDIPGNSIRINNKGAVRFSLGEPFEGDGTDEVLEEVLEEWLKLHTFESNPDEKFYDILREAYEQLPEISFENKKELQQVIDKLVRAQTYMK